VDWSCFLLDADGLDGEDNETDETEASDRRFAAADNTGILLLLMLLQLSDDDDDDDDADADRKTKYCQHSRSRLLAAVSLWHCC